jgi:hypothetical protein
MGPIGCPEISIRNYHYSAYLIDISGKLSVPSSGFNDSRILDPLRWDQ